MLELRVRCTSRQGWGVWSTIEAEGWNIHESWPWGKREKCQNVGQNEASGPAVPENMGDVSSTGIWQQSGLKYSSRDVGRVYAEA